MTPSGPVIQVGLVAANDPVCREHLRLTITAERFPIAQPGQFVHLCPAGANEASGAPGGGNERRRPGEQGFMLRRAFSIAGLRRTRTGTSIEILYRVMGRGTRWLASLRAGNRISVLGPAGNTFPVHPAKSHAWLVAGGVGLPPLLWLAEALHAAGKQVVAFCGARSADLLPIGMDPDCAPATDARTAHLCVRELAAHAVPAVISTDDGSLGYRGQVGEAMAAYHACHAMPAADLVVYACGPEAMLRSVAQHCGQRGLECYVCMERAMACGIGTCQSCVVPVRDPADPEGWRYVLCCTEGPVFAAGDVIWDDPQRPERKQQVHCGK